jgi:hypothetical protein
MFYRRSAFAAFLLAALSGCDSESSSFPLLRDPPAGSRPIGPRCESSDPQRFCVSLRYVVYQEPSQPPVVDEAQALGNLEVINSVWSQCGIAFQVDEYFEAEASRYSLRHRPAEYRELGDIRRVFGIESSFVVVTTGPWDRTGSLGSTGANAWTTMPGGDGPWGAILEKRVGSYSIIFAHELGHYLNLSHVSDSGDVMNPVIYSTSTKLEASQCDTARAAVTRFWQQALR